MNLFVTDSDPRRCAAALDDKRVGKLLMEANQLLSHSVRLRGHPSPSDFGEGRLVRGRAYETNSLAIWVRSNADRHLWTLCHARALADEYAARFGRSHGSAARTDHLEALGVPDLDSGPLEPFVNSARRTDLGIDCTWIPDVSEAYREYLRLRWARDSRPVTWTNSCPPSWRRSP